MKNTLFRAKLCDAKEESKKSGVGKSEADRRRVGKLLEKLIKKISVLGVGEKKRKYEIGKHR